MTPLPLHEKRRPESLLSHIKYPKAMAREMGLMMPTQRDISGAETEAIWRWMRAATKTKIKPYRP